MFPKNRLVALSDGIFAVAMTLLILDVRLQEDFQPHNPAEFLHGLAELWPKFLPYLLSFAVLGLRWLSNIGVRSRSEFVGREYVNWWMLYLLLITCVPFSTIVIGRYSNFAPAIWLYAGHTLLIALVGYRLIRITPEPEPGPLFRQRLVSALLLIASSVLAIVLSLFEPRFALWAFALNGAAPLFRRWDDAAPPHARAAPPADSR
jgi:uncharacterized membrane protein